MSVTSATPHRGFGNERNGRHWLRAAVLTSSARNHTTATMVTTFPGPLYLDGTVRTPQNTLNARINPAETVARRTDASCARRAARSCSRAAPSGIEPDECFSIPESYHTTCRYGKSGGLALRSDMWEGGSRWKGLDCPGQPAQSARGSGPSDASGAAGRCAKQADSCRPSQPGGTKHPTADGPRTREPLKGQKARPGVAGLGLDHLWAHRYRISIRAVPRARPSRSVVCRGFWGSVTR